MLHNNQKCVMIAWPTKNKIFPCLKFFVSVPYSSSCTQIIHLCYFFLYLIQKVSTVASKPVSDKCVFPNRVTIDAMENLLLLSQRCFFSNFTTGFPFFGQVKIWEWVKLLEEQKVGA